MQVKQTGDTGVEQENFHQSLDVTLAKTIHLHLCSCGPNNIMYPRTKVHKLLGISHNVKSLRPIEILCLHALNHSYQRDMTLSGNPSSNSMICRLYKVISTRPNYKSKRKVQDAMTGQNKRGHHEWGGEDSWRGYVGEGG